MSWPYVTALFLPLFQGKTLGVRFAHCFIQMRRAERSCFRKPSRKAFVKLDLAGSTKAFAVWRENPWPRVNTTTTPVVTRPFEAQRISDRNGDLATAQPRKQWSKSLSCIKTESGPPHRGRPPFALNLRRAA
jgi:hypothetical protein